MSTVDLLNLPCEIIQRIVTFLSLPDVTKCQLVCRQWKEHLSSESFWKEYLHFHWNFDIEPNPKDSYLGSWQNDWFCYWGDEATETVFTNPPKMWKNGIIHPADYSIEGDEGKKYSDLLRAVYILDRLYNAGKELGLDVTAWGNEGSSSVEVCLFPWNKNTLPKAKDIVDIFHFNSVFHDYLMESFFKKKMKIKSSEDDESDHSDQEEEEVEAGEDNEEDDPEDEDDLYHESTSYIRWARIHASGDNIQKEIEFFKWMRKTFFPFKQYCLGCDAMNPTPFFMLSQISPGWVGGIISGLALT